MAEIKKSVGPRDFKERFEFVFTVNDNIICQRYFKINAFNAACTRSYELTRAIRKCAHVIDTDLKEKTNTYLEIYAPKVFSSYKEMVDFVKNPENAKRFSPGEGLVVKGSSVDYIYTNTGDVKPLEYKFDDGEITEVNVQDNKCTYRFAFKVDGREVCATIWDGYYPKFVRDKIDLSNKRGRFEDDDKTRLSFEQYLLYKMGEGKSDLVYGLISEICYACSLPNTKDYTTKVDDILEEWRNDSTDFTRDYFSEFVENGKTGQE